MTTIRKSARIHSIDGFRGIAIFLVLLFHYFSRWSSTYSQSLYPYGDEFANLFGTKDGFVGVYLFFIVSGFVIFGTLQRCPSMLSFWLKRADRLLPPMLFMSVLSFLLLSSVLATPYLEVRLVDFIPSWTLSAPALWTWVDPNIGYIDGVYWTLFVELRFYIFISIVWFLLPKVNIAYMVALFAYVGVGLFMVVGALDAKSLGKLTNLIFFPQYSSFFAAGVLYFQLWSGLRKPGIFFGLAMLIPIGLFMVGRTDDFHQAYISVYVWVIAFHVSFLLVAFRTRGEMIFSFRPFVTLGTISYSFYLFHQGVGVALIHRIHYSGNYMLLAAQMLLIIAFVGFVSTLSWKYIESRKLVSAAFSLARKSKVLHVPERDQ